MKKIFALLLLTLLFSGCEKDDICTEDTTPRLVIAFYDISNPANIKNVVNLKVKGTGAVDDLDLDVFNAESKIKLPLNPTTNSVKYSLIMNSTSTTLANEDFLEFNYTTQTVYVSRACGYKTIYQLNDLDGVVQSNAATPDVSWIQNLTIQTNAITSENEIHIKIYF
jgi:hypothetical protein